jgi:hypothetical protein
VDDERIDLFTTIFKSDEEIIAPLPSIHSIELINSLNKIFSLRSHISKWYFTDGFNETNAINNSQIIRQTKIPDIERYEMIYSGPHFFVSNPLYQTPKKICNTHRSYDSIDPYFQDKNIQRTNYIPSKNFRDIDRDIFDKKWLESFKLIFSKMINLTNARSLQSCIVPPKSSHINSVVSLSFKNDHDLIRFGSLCSSVVYDFLLRISGVSNLYESLLKSMPFPSINSSNQRIFNQLIYRYLRLNCIDDRYETLWNSFDFREKCIDYPLGKPQLRDIQQPQLKWDKNTRVKSYFELRWNLLEIDVLSSMIFGIELDELCQIFEVQFSVELQNDLETYYDSKGNIVFTNNKSLSSIGVDRSVWESIRNMKDGETYEHTIEKSELYHGEKVTYYAPFEKCDRVEDYKAAWAHFEKIFNQN